MPPVSAHRIETLADGVELHLGRGRPALYTGCLVEGCGKPHKAKGYCQGHYLRLKSANGVQPETPLIKMGVTRQWILDNVGYDSDECLAWPFARNSWGYGVCRIDVAGRPFHQAHIAMCVLVYGKAPPDKPEVSHFCDNPWCVNARHLRWSTRKQNMADRSYPPFGKPWSQAASI